MSKNDRPPRCEEFLDSWAQLTLQDRRDMRAVAQQGGHGGAPVPEGPLRNKLINLKLAFKSTARLRADAYETILSIRVPERRKTG